MEIKTIVVTMPVAVAANAAGPDPSKHFTIINKEGQFCVSGGELDECSVAHAYKFTKVGTQSAYGGFDGVYTVKSEAGRCLSANGRSGDLVTEADCSGSDKQKWMTRTGDAHYFYHYGDQNFGDGKKPKCLDVPNSDYTVGKKLQLYDCKSQGNQGWSLYQAAPSCTAKKATGYWSVVKSIVSAGEEISVMWGTEVTHTESRTKTWRNSVSTTIAKGFEAEGESSSVSVTTDESKATSEKVTDAIKQTTEIGYKLPFSKQDVGKDVWQWQMHVVDTCGHKETIKSLQFAITPDRDTPPCCLPTFQAHQDPSYQSCVAKATNLCKHKSVAV
jgi:hypothetical protein